jgi:hypothetical protein
MQSSPWSVRAPLAQGVAPTASPKAPPAHPDWFREVRRKYTLRLTDWATQAWAITVAPHRFLADWVGGRRDALNPLRFFAVGTALMFLVDRGGRKLLHIAPAPSQGLLGVINSSTGSTALVFLGATLLHVVLRLRSKAPLRSSVAAVLFTHAGPGAFLSILGWLLSAAIHVVQGHVSGALYNGAFTPWPVIGLDFVGFGWVVAALVGVHRVRWWWSVLALAAAPVILGLGMGALFLVLQLVAPLRFHQQISVYDRSADAGAFTIGITKSEMGSN